MDDAQFLDAVDEAGISRAAFSIGARKDEAYVLEHALIGWTTFYSERGKKQDPKRFGSRSAALTDLLARLRSDASTRIREVGNGD